MFISMERTSSNVIVMTLFEEPIQQLKPQFWVALINSVKGRQMDQKVNLDQNTLYLFNGNLYNRNEAGNLIWRARMNKLGFSEGFSLFAADTAKGFKDVPWDQRAISVGWRHANMNNLLK